MSFLQLPALAVRTNSDTNEINFITAFNTCAALNIRIPSRLGTFLCDSFILRFQDEPL